MAGTNPSHVAKKDQRGVNRKAPKFDEETGRKKEAWCIKFFSTLVGLTKRSVEDVTKEEGTERHGEAQIVSLPVVDGNQKPDPRRLGDVGAEVKKLEERWESVREESRRTL